MIIKCVQIIQSVNPIQSASRARKGPVQQRTPTCGLNFHDKRNFLSPAKNTQNASHITEPSILIVLPGEDHLTTEQYIFNNQPINQSINQQQQEEEEHQGYYR